MMRKLISGAAVMAASLAVATGPVSAHVNSEVDRQHDHRLEQGAIAPGFIGPIEDTDGERTPGEVATRAYVKAHSGMECGALRSPNIAALGPVDRGGAGFDDRFLCPSAPEVSP